MTDHPFIAVLLYETTGGVEDHRHEDVLLLRAADRAAALERAELRGRNQSYRYVGPHGEKLEQRMLRVESVQEFSDEDLAGDVELLTRPV